MNPFGHPKGIFCELKLCLFEIREPSAGQLRMDKNSIHFDLERSSTSDHANHVHARDLRIKTRICSSPVIGTPPITNRHFNGLLNSWTIHGVIQRTIIRTTSDFISTLIKDYRVKSYHGSFWKDLKLKSVFRLAVSSCQRIFHFVRGIITLQLNSGFTSFTCFVYFELTTGLLVWWNPNQSNRRSDVQKYFPLWSEYSRPEIFVIY